MRNEILLIDDNDHDVELVIRALRENNLANNIVRLKDGQQALNYFFKEKNPIPQLILLDLRMPGMDGLDVLYQLKSNEATKRIPIVVLTSSNMEEDMLNSYNSGVNGYTVKPVTFAEFSKAINEIVFFWLGFNHPPAY